MKNSRHAVVAVDTVVAVHAAVVHAVAVAADAAAAVHTGDQRKNAAGRQEEAPTGYK